MQFHQGSRLKFLIEKSPYKIKEISENSGIPTSSLYDMYKKPELLPSKIQPILTVLGIDIPTFYNVPDPGDDDDNEKNVLHDKAARYNANQALEACRREVELLKQQLTSKDEIIELLKKSQN